MLRAANAHRVADVGCGEGALTAALLADEAFTEVIAADVSSRALEIAERRLRVDRMPPRRRERLSLIQSSVTYRDQRLAGLDALVLMEVIEHIDQPRLAALERTVFAEARPEHVVVTTPNSEYNIRFEFLPAGSDAPPRSPLRVDAPRVRGLGPAGRRRERLRGQVPAGGPGGSRGRLTHPDGCFQPSRCAGGRARVCGSQHGVSEHAVSEQEPKAPAGGRVIDVPELSLVVLMGASGAGKSTFARNHFAPTEVISSDFCRGLVADNENDQSASKDAFDVMHYIAGKRLAAGRLTVIDATNVQQESRKHLLNLAREHDVLPVAIVFDLPEHVCVGRNAVRPDRPFGAHVIRRQRDQLRRGMRGLEREGFRRVHILRSEAEVSAALVTRTRLFNDLRDQTGPFDVIGDVHGCRGELEQLLDRPRLRAEPGRERPGGRCPASGRAAARLPGRPGGSRPGYPWRPAPCHGNGRGRRRIVRAWQPREQAAQGAARAQGSSDPRPGRVARAAGGRASGFPGRSGVLSRRAHLPLRPGRRQAGGQPRRTARTFPGPGIGPGAQLLPVRGDDRRDRRVRTACPLSVGERIPRQRDGAVRPHAGAGRGVGERHDVPGHRLRVRRAAHRAALSRARARLGGSDQGLLRASPTFPGGLRGRVLRCRGSAGWARGQARSRRSWTSPM